VTLARRIDLWLPPLLLMAVIFVLSDQPDLSSGLGVIDVIGRKLVHALEYALLCALWWRLLREVMPSRRAALAALCISVAYAVTDEYHQSFVEGRNGSPVDVGIDAIGAGAAAFGVTRPARSRA
jgi:VanZ family protein